MTNLPNNERQDFLSFLQQNQPIPPQASANLEQNIVDALEVRSSDHHQFWKSMQILMKAIALHNPLKFITTGFLFICFSFNFKTPRIAIEPKDLENFLVKNWQDTLHKNSFGAIEEAEAHLLLPATTETQSALSISAP